MSKPLIIGIDPGTTSGYAVLDIDGNVVEINSSKELGIDELMKQVYKFGKPILIGCDKHKVPGFVEKFAQRIRAKVCWPRSDMLVDEKSRLVKGYDYKNSHEKDALASAIFAYHNVKELFQKINDFAARENKTEQSDKLKEIMVKNPELNIPAALRKITGPEKIIQKQEIMIIKKVEDKDYLNLKQKQKKLLGEKDLLFKENKNLKDLITKLENRIKDLAAKQVISLDDKIKKKIYLKDRNLNTMYSKESEKDLKLLRQDKDICQLNKFLSSLKDNVLLKKLDNLGAEEFNKKNPVLNIRQNDCLLVDDCSIVSDVVIAQLNKNLNIIIFRNKLSKKVNACLCCIAATSLKLEESKYFALANKAELDKEIRKNNIIEKVVEEYRKEKKD